MSEVPKPYPPRRIDYLDWNNVADLLNQMRRCLYYVRQIEGGVTIDPETGEIRLMVAADRGGAVVQVATPFLYGYGVYEYWVEINVHDPETTMFFGFMEEAPSNADENSIIFKAVGGSYSFETRKDGELTSTSIEGVDLRNKGTIKLNWEPGRARLYVDGELKADHTSNVPEVKGVIFAEIYRANPTSNRLEMRVEPLFGMAKRFGL